MSWPIFLCYSISRLDKLRGSTWHQVVGARFHPGVATFSNYLLRILRLLKDYVRRIQRHMCSELRLY